MSNILGTTPQSPSEWELGFPRFLDCPGLSSEGQMVFTFLDCGKNIVDGNEGTLNTGFPPHLCLWQLSVIWP